MSFFVMLTSMVASAVLGFFYLAILFFVCLTSVYYIRSNFTQKSTQENNETKTSTEQKNEVKQEEKPNEQVVYYIVEKKKSKKEKYNLNEPKQIHFDK